MKMPEVTRRTALAALGGIAGVAAVERTATGDEPAKKTTRRRSNLSDIEKEYRRLLALWQEERKQFAYSSNTYDYWKGPHGKAIIALGPIIIPYLIQELRKGDFWFNVPLTLMSNVEFNGAGAIISEQDRAKLWL